MNKLNVPEWLTDRQKTPTFFLYDRRSTSCETKMLKTCYPWIHMSTGVNEIFCKILSEQKHVKKRVKMSKSSIVPHSSELLCRMYNNPKLFFMNHVFINYYHEEIIQWILRVNNVNRVELEIKHFGNVKLTLTVQPCCETSGLPDQSFLVSCNELLPCHEFVLSDLIQHLDDSGLSIVSLETNEKESVLVHVHLHEFVELTCRYTYDLFELQDHLALYKAESS